MIKSYNITPFELERGTYPDIISPEETLNAPYDHFIDASDIIEELSKTFPKLSEEYLTSFRERTRKKIANLDPAGKKAYQRYKSYFEQVKRKTGAPKPLSLKITHKKLAKILNEAYDIDSLHAQFAWFLREMSLVYLVTKFEDFLKHCLTNVYLIIPEAMKTSKKNMSFEEIFSVKKFEDLQTIAIDKELDDVMRKDIVGINKYLSDHFKLDLSNNHDWNKFKECFYRRNVIIHNEGDINEEYRRNTGYKGEEADLRVTENYLMAALRLFNKYSKLVWDFFNKKFFRLVVFVDESGKPLKRDSRSMG